MLLFNLTRHFKKHYQLLSTNLITFPENKYLLNKNVTGNDEKYEKNMTLVNITTANEMEKILLLYNKKRILDILQNGEISTNAKLVVVTTNFDEFDNYNIKPSNLKAGGLLKDSEFDF
jgi:hypothetical protein